MKQIFLIVFILILMSCSEDNDIQHNTTIHELGSNVYDDSSEKDIDFLTLEDSVNPAEWMVHKIMNEEPDKYEGMSEVNSLLALLDKKFTESPRMIANRIKQTFELLEENQLSFHLLDFMRDSIEIPTEGSMTVFGSYCQQYLNLRNQGITHNYAIKTLIEKRSNY